METPWGDIAISDAHVHFLSPAFFAALEKQKGGPIGPELKHAGIEASQGDVQAFARRWVEELDRYGVASATLIGSVPGDEASVAAAMQSFPDRFHGFFMVDPTQPDGRGRVQAALEQGLRGVCFFPAMQRYSMHDDRVTEILQLLSERSGVVAFVHCGALSVGIRSKLGLPSRFDLQYSNPIDVHAAAVQFPRVPFVIPHFGAGYFREALMLADMCPNVYFDTSSSNHWIKYQVPMMDVRDAFRRSIDLLGAHRLLFGTDSSTFPAGWNRGVFEAQTNLLFDLGIGTDDASLILGGNLRRILTLP